MHSIKAKIRERVLIGDRAFQTEGIYLQGTELQLKLELKVVPDDSPDPVRGAFLEVCDGTILWTRHQIGNQTRITRRDVRQILNAARACREPNLLAMELGLGGLPALIASLEGWMKFDPVSRQDINGKKFTVLTGVWKEPILKSYQNLLGQQKLLDHIPDSVRIYFEPEILFPRRIAYLKHRIPQGPPEMMLELDFLDIEINAEIEKRQFDFVPPNGIRTVDVTNEYLLQLKPPASK